MTNKLSNSKIPGKRRAWPPKRRREQAARAKAQKPWARSTGPKTQDGKRIVSRNAYDHGFRSADMVEIRHLLREQRLHVQALMARHCREYASK